jgi:hypothetical protein
MYKKIYELLERASNSLQYYCGEINGDMNDALATEIDKFLRENPIPCWRTDFENIPNDDFMFEEYQYTHYTIPVLITIKYKSGKKGVVMAYSYQYQPDSDEYKNRWVYVGADGRYVEHEVLAYQLLPEPCEE